ncbi:MAG TPA: response regulator [Candidatus Saccharimonadales bacterium]|nr:response regulator [Candidatus Saccharimonadales bacterium]
MEETEGTIMGDTQKKVLIVEDERPLAHALELKLQHEGFAVTVASDGQECLDLLKDQTFDVVLLDLIMPVMDGFQVLEQMKQLPQMPAVFVLSNLSQHEDEDRVLALGARKFFIKSDTPLTTIVEEVKAV